MMKRFLPFFTMLLGFVPLFAHAAALSGDLIKGSGSAVYYFGADAKRYVFPTQKTYAAWYADFNGVRQISDTELASYPLGGNATYRPGVRMVKVTTDSKVYAVARGGTLRWITSESVAAALYGASWATQIDDLPDTFFTNYHVGASISSTNDYSPSAEQQNAPNINADKNLIAVAPAPAPTPTPTPTPPPSGPVYAGMITVSDANPRVGSAISLEANATVSQSITAIRLFFDGVQQTSCMQGICTTSLAIPYSSAKSVYEARADFDWITGQHFSATTTVTIDSSTSSIVLLTVDHPEVKPNRYANFTIDVSNNYRAVSIDVYVDGVRVPQGCTNVQRCTLAYQDPGPAGITRSVYAVAIDGQGYTHQSVTKSYQVVANDHPIVSVTADKTLVQKNEIVNVTVNAADDDQIAWTEIWLDGTLLKRCQTLSCTVQAGPWSASRTMQFMGKAADIAGLVGQGTSTQVTVL